MQVTIRFLGVLSVKYGSEPIPVEIDPTHTSLTNKIQALTGSDSSVNCFILRNGKPHNSSDALKDGDEFCVFSPISGG